MVKSFSLQVSLLRLQFMTTVIHSSAPHLNKKTGSLLSNFIVGTSRVLLDIPKTSRLQADQAQLAQPLFRRQVFYPKSAYHPFAKFSTVYQLLSCIGKQNWMQHYRCGLDLRLTRVLVDFWGLRKNISAKISVLHS